MARPHSASLIGELRFAEDGVFTVIRRVNDKAHCYRFLMSLNVYRNKVGVFGGALRLQIMELRKRGLRFDVVADAAKERKDALVGAVCAV